ncbi:MAG: acylase [Bacteroidetes bacterium]|nr:MAG: acylase [Bacteroidota bacterium]
MVMRLNLFFLLCSSWVMAQSFSPAEILSWEQQAARVTIIRDDWGIPHIYGPTDADAVFGMLYAQCEDDFARVERNYLEATGQLAMALGKDYLYHDLRTRLWMDSTAAKKHLAAAPKDLQALCVAFADGINYYLHTHPTVQPAWITRFQPWMPFTFSEGSIGGDTYWVSTTALAKLYGQEERVHPTPDEEDNDDLNEEPRGSNGFAIGKQLTTQGKALLLINPHTSFYFRTEQQVQSEEGLNVYGAATWGQFFIYQGFNENCGWMHTSTKADAIDEVRETIIPRDGHYYYRYGKEERLVEEREIEVSYREDGQLTTKSFKTYHTHHGPIIRQDGNDWIAYRIMNRPLDALTQSFGRTKAKGYGGFKKTMKLRTNSSNNTVFADRKGNIAYWHGNFIPKRDPAFDYRGTVDGSNPATDWQGLHTLGQMVHLRNPKNGWLQNCNATPFTVAGANSINPTKYRSYLAPDQENFRGINAVRVLSSHRSYTLDTLIAAANDPYLAAFAELVPALEGAYQEAIDPANRRVASAVRMLTNWDRNCAVESVPTALAIYWGEALLALASPRVTPAERNRMMMDEWMIQHTSAKEKLIALEAAMDKLEADFGNWQTPWGLINRFQRLDGSIDATFSDERPSLPVGFASAHWGSLASLGTVQPPGTRKRYGTSGNSFVAVVSFGDRLEARAVVSGGQSGDSRSPHFRDQAEAYCKGEFRPVYFYRTDVEAHQERQYHPGQ